MYSRERTDGDIGRITIGPGPSHYGRECSVSFDATQVSRALGIDDARINRIWAKIEKAFRELDEQAPLAVQRHEKAEAKRKRQEERENKARKKMQSEALATISPEEKARCVKLLRWVELDNLGEFERDSVYHLISPNEGDLRRGDDGRLYISAPVAENSFNQWPFDLTTGQWVLPIAPEDLFVGKFDLRGYGHRIERESDGDNE